MTYGYDAYTWGGAGMTRVGHIKRYKTKTGVKKAMNRYLEGHKEILIGWVLYRTSDESSYNPDDYTVLDRYNHKAFFEYWR